MGSHFTLAIFAHCFWIFLANLIISGPYFSWIHLKILILVYSCKINKVTRSFMFRWIPLIYLIYIKNIYNISLIIQPTLSSKNKKCFYKLKVINLCHIKSTVSSILIDKMKSIFDPKIKDKRTFSFYSWLFPWLSLFPFSKS